MKNLLLLLTIPWSQMIAFPCVAQTFEHLPYDKIDQIAPNFRTVTLDGDSVNLFDFQGKVVVLNFWHLRCGACWLEVPDFNQIKKEYEGAVAVLSVTLDNDSALWQKFSKSEKGYKMDRKFNGNDEFNYIILPDGKEIAEAYGVTSYPTTFYINQEGQIKQILPYFMSYEGSGMKTNYQWMKEAIEEIL